MTNSILENTSLIFSFTGCAFVVISFLYQLHKIYKTKNSSGTSWGLIIPQIIASFFLSIGAGINVYLKGLLNIPFLILNIAVTIISVIMLYFKCIFKVNTSQKISKINTKDIKNISDIKIV